MDANGILEFRTGKRSFSPVEIASGAVIFAALAGVGWLVFRPDAVAPAVHLFDRDLTESSQPAALSESAPAFPAQTATAAPSPATRDTNTPAAAASVAPTLHRRQHSPRMPHPKPVPGVAPADDDQQQRLDEGSSDQLTGIAAFPPLGTKPILRGIVVPEGFDLPSGYVRHYQATDDGRLLPPILRFHPDYHPLGASGNPLSLPRDGVVPPEMAPQGLPIEYLEPPPQGPSRW